MPRFVYRFALSSINSFIRQSGGSFERAFVLLVSFFRYFFHIQVENVWQSIEFRSSFITSHIVLWTSIKARRLKTGQVFILHEAGSTRQIKIALNQKLCAVLRGGVKFTRLKFYGQNRKPILRALPLQYNFRLLWLYGFVILIILLFSLPFSLFLAVAQDSFKCPDDFGFYPHHTSCDKYWKCDNNVAELKTCGNGLAFDASDSKYLTENCDYLHNVDCGDRTQLGNYDTCQCTLNRARAHLSCQK